MPSLGLGEKGIDFGRPHLDTITFNGGTGIKRPVGHPGFLGSAFGTLGIHRLGKAMEVLASICRTTSRPTLK